MLPDTDTVPDEPGEAFPLLATGESPLLGDAPAGVVGLLAGAVGLLEAEVAGVVGLAVMLAFAVGLPQLASPFRLACFFVVPLAVAVAVTVA